MKIETEHGVITPVFVGRKNIVPFDTVTDRRKARRLARKHHGRFSVSRQRPRQYTVRCPADCYMIPESALPASVYRVYFNEPGDSRPL